MKLENKCKVLILSDTTAGGASVSCKRLFDALKKHSSDMNLSMCAYDGESSQDVYIASQWQDFFSFIRYRIVCALNKREYYAQSLCSKLASRTISKVVRKSQLDVINIHNIHSVTDFSLLEALPKQMPIVWTLHDMWALTGYCCYSNSCQKYMNGCRGECPEAGNWGAIFRPVEKEWQHRQMFFNSNLSRITFVTPSKWLHSCVKMRLPEAKILTVPYSLDLSVFNNYLSRQKAREALGLSPSKKTILFGADAVSDKRKGIDLLINAVEMFDDELRSEFQIVGFGTNKGNIGLPADFIRRGVIRDEQLLNLYYRAADVYVLPTRADNLPNTLIEATAAGTPSVAFDVGGCSEVIENGSTGYLANAEDTGVLADCIMRVLAQDDLSAEKMSIACRHRAEALYSPELQASRYNNIIRDLF
ncbi:hypothetical protein BVX94_02900 [bacterium B17]|nr:hypothetical protein BVX94_02900 [bacterium B17]